MRYTSPESRNNFPEHTVNIPDDAPTVVCDATLGQRYSNVEFDYATFNKEAERLSYPPHATNELTIHINGSGPTFYSTRTKGLHLSGEYGINKKLAHEMQHASDHAHGQLEQSSTYKADIMAIKAAPVLMSLGVLATVGGAVAENADLALTGVGATAIFMTTFLIGAHRYLNNPNEIRAYSAERNISGKTIKLTRK